MADMYKVVEVSPVDDVQIEKVINTWTAQGYVLERVQFVTQDGIRRPVMAYIFLVRTRPNEPAPSSADVDDSEGSDPEGSGG